MNKQNKRPSFDKIYQLLNHICTWANAVLIQGERVLENNKTLQQLAPTSTLNGKRIMDEHFFLTASKQLMSFTGKSKIIPGFKEKRGKENAFSSANKISSPILNELRNNMEHAVNYLDNNQSNKKPLIHKNKSMATGAMSTVIMENATLKDNNGEVRYGKAYLLGGCVDVYVVMKAQKHA